MQLALVRASRHKEFLSMPTKRSAFAAPSECPVCGAEVPRDARACPQCGADERTGWNEENTRYDGLGLPDEAFSEGTTSKNKEPSRRFSPMGLSVFWWLVGVGIALLITYLVFAGKF